MFRYTLPPNDGLAGVAAPTFLRSCVIARFCKRDTAVGAPLGALMRYAVPKIDLAVALAALCALVSGCGTTKWSDSPRTATEQLLISDAVDRAISEIDFSALAERSVYLDTRYIITALDQNYVISTLRQHMLASGCVIKDKADDADYVVEVRTGSLGTNRQDLLLGVPATNLPTAGLLPIGSASIPEIAFMKRTNQQGVCKLAVFAYDRMSGRPVWQSGNRKIASRAKDTWVLGTGPFQRGEIYDGTAFAGEKLQVPLVGKSKKNTTPNSSVAQEKVFPHQIAAQPNTESVDKAGYVVPLPPNTLPPAAPAAGSGATPLPTPPKAAYTPPPPPAVVVPPPAPPPVATGPQGNLTQQPMFSPTSNPAAATASAIQAFNWAKGAMEKQKEPE
jgi:hypothetical protein